MGSRRRRLPNRVASETGPDGARGLPARKKRSVAVRPYLSIFFAATLCAVLAGVDAAPPSQSPTLVPSALPTLEPSSEPTLEPTADPTGLPTLMPTGMPTLEPTGLPTAAPSSGPSLAPTSSPTLEPTSAPSSLPTMVPTSLPTLAPSALPTIVPTLIPTFAPYNLTTISSAVVLRVPVTKFGSEMQKALRATLVHELPFVTSMSEVSITSFTSVNGHARGGRRRYLAGMEDAESDRNSQEMVGGESFGARSGRLLSTPTISIADVDGEYPCGDTIEFDITVTNAEDLEDSCSSFQIRMLDQLGVYQGLLTPTFGYNEGSQTYSYTAGVGDDSASPVDTDKFCTGTKYHVLVYCSMQYYAKTPSNFTISVPPTPVPSPMPSSVPTLAPTSMPTITLVPTISLQPTSAPSPQPTLDGASFVSFEITIKTGVTSVSEINSKAQLRKRFERHMRSSIRSTNFSKELRIEGSIYNVTDIHLDNSTLMQNLTVAEVKAATITLIEEKYIAPTITPTLEPTSAPSFSPSLTPSNSPTLAPTAAPSLPPSLAPSLAPSLSPSLAPTASPTLEPSLAPTHSPTLVPSSAPSLFPSLAPTAVPTLSPTSAPSLLPTLEPTAFPSKTYRPSPIPSLAPSTRPTLLPSALPSLEPSSAPSSVPSLSPTAAPTLSPSFAPSSVPSLQPSGQPSLAPTSSPSLFPTSIPSGLPTLVPSRQPSDAPTGLPTPLPTLRPSPNPTSKHPTLLPTIGPHTYAKASASITLTAPAYFTRPSDFTVTHEKAFALALVESSAYLTDTKQVFYVNATRARGTRRRNLLGASALEINFILKIILEKFGMDLQDDKDAFAKSIMRDIGADLADAVMNGTHTLFATAFIEACAEKGITITDVAALAHSLRSLTTSVFYYDPVPSEAPTPAPSSIKTKTLGDGDGSKGAAMHALYGVVGGVGAIILLCAFVKQRGRPNTQATNFAKKTKISGKKVLSVLDAAEEVITFKHRNSGVVPTEFAFEDEYSEFQIDLDGIESKLGDSGDYRPETRVPTLSAAKVRANFRKADQIRRAAEAAKREEAKAAKAKPKSPKKGKKDDKNESPKKNEKPESGEEKEKEKEKEKKSDGPKNAAVSGDEAVAEDPEKEIVRFDAKAAAEDIVGRMGEIKLTRYEKYLKRREKAAQDAKDNAEFDG